MTRAVEWSRDALDDVKKQVVFIAADNPNASLRVADRIDQTAMALGAFATGRPGRVTGTYEKPVARLPYIIAYAIAERAGREAIVILRVIHISRDWPPEEWPQ